VFFFNDECDIRDDDQYDFFTLATQVERRRPRADRLPSDRARAVIAAVVGALKQGSTKGKNLKPEM
jgi:hypothetical protein